RRAELPERRRRLASAWRTGRAGALDLVPETGRGPHPRSGSSPSRNPGGPPATYQLLGEGADGRGHARAPDAGGRGPGRETAGPRRAGGRNPAGGIGARLGGHLAARPSEDPRLAATAERGGLYHGVPPPDAQARARRRPFAVGASGRAH